MTNFLPSRRFQDVFERMDRMFGPFTWPRDMGMKMEWSPTADIIESDKEYLVKAELPEVSKEDISLEVRDGTLVIGAARVPLVTELVPDYYGPASPACRN